MQRTKAPIVECAKIVGQKDNRNIDIVMGRRTFISI
jgi:hypothetical protein